MGKTDDMSSNVLSGEDSIKKPHKHRLRGFNLFAVIVFVVAMGFLGFKIINRKLAVQSGCGGQATSPLYDSAVKEMDPKRMQQLKVVVDTIQKTKGYEDDINCLYPVATYYFYKEQTVDARKIIEKMDVQISQSQKIAKVYSDRSFTVQSLKNQVGLIEKIKKNDSLNKPGFSN